MQAGLRILSQTIDHRGRYTEALHRGRYTGAPVPTRNPETLIDLSQTSASGAVSPRQHQRPPMATQHSRSAARTMMAPAVFLLL
ncbi:MAG TPA: hypothetical protein EYP31_10100, partial [Roseibacterium sp.]|nr:hypothetical protein [Roseibacterium sp.]